MERCYAKGVFRDEKLHELKGRLLLVLKRFEKQLASFQKIDNLFKDEGKKWLSYFVSIFENSKKLIPNLESEVSIAEQPYDFDYAVFLKHNPITSIGR